METWEAAGEALGRRGRGLRGTRGLEVTVEAAGRRLRWERRPSPASRSKKTSPLQR